MTEVLKQEEVYELYVSYSAETDDLAASFEFLSKVVSNQNKADKFMLQGLEAGLSTKITLNDIQKSSIRLFLINLITNTDENQIRDKGAVAYLNQFLIEVRKPFLKYAATHETLDSRDDLKNLRKAAIEIAQRNNVSSIQIEGMSDAQMAEHLANYSLPAGLSHNQTYKAKCAGEEFVLNRNFRVTQDQISKVLDEKEEILTGQLVYLKPKTAVYEGNGMWEFHESKSGKVVKGKILHESWLEDFQKGTMPHSEYPYPGTILKVIADIIIKFDESNFRKSEAYMITHVYGPVAPEDVSQHTLSGL